YHGQTASFRFVVHCYLTCQQSIYRRISPLNTSWQVMPESLSLQGDCHERQKRCQCDQRAYGSDPWLPTELADLHQGKRARNAGTFPTQPASIAERIERGGA